MNPYQRGHTWNPYNCNGGPTSVGGLLPNRVATLSDVRYRSFQAPAQISSRAAKSRTSLALPSTSGGSKSIITFICYFHDWDINFLIRNLIFGFSKKRLFFYRSHNLCSSSSPFWTLSFQIFWGFLPSIGPFPWAPPPSKWNYEVKLIYIPN